MAYRATFRSRPRGGTGRMMVVGLAAVLAACAPTSTGSEAAAEPPSALAPTPVPTSLPSLPSAPPGWTPEESAPILTVTQIVDVCADRCDLPQVALYPDGSLLDWGDHGDPLPVARRLTPAGMTSLLDIVRVSGLLGASRTIEPAGPVDMGQTTWVVTAAVDGTTRTVSAGDAVPSAEGRRFLDLVDRLTRAPDILPSDAFVDRDATGVVYRPRSERLRVETAAVPREPGWWHPATTLEAVGWPFPDRPDVLGEPLEVAGEPDRSVRCELVDGELAARLRMGIDRAGLDLTSTRFLTWWEAGSAIVAIDLHPFLPEERPACDGADLPEAVVVERVPVDALDIVAAIDGAGDPLGQPVLEVSLFRSGLEGGQLARLRYLRGGLVVVDEPPSPAVRYGTLALTDAGLDGVLAFADRSGLLDDPTEIVSSSDQSTLATITRWCRPDCSNPVEVRADDHAAGLVASRVMDLARRLADPASWLPSSALARGSAVRPYAPPRGYVIVASLPVTDDRTDAVAALPHLPPAAAVQLPDGRRLLDIGAEVRFERWPGDDDPRAMRCLEVGGRWDVVRDLARALEIAGADHHRPATLGPGSSDVRASWELRGEVPDTMIVVELLLPDPFSDSAATGCQPALETGLAW